MPAPPCTTRCLKTADGGGVVYWQKLILCCSAGSASPRGHQPHLPAGGVVEKRGDAGEPACRCEDVRCGDVAAAADDWLQAKLTQRPLAVWLAAAASRERAVLPPPARKRLLPSAGAERRAVTATLLHRRARQGRQAQ
ncbi:hypothetical protein LNP74_17335 [Klebsiella pneumoniae subsp. pneumoniae]|nr:hypothetical protein [Klebsiella pneumoniae subsp. pneumoniae]